MDKMDFSSAAQILQDQYSYLDFTLQDYFHKARHEKIYHWPGRQDEDVLVLVHKSDGVKEVFHRHEFFYFNYTYKGCYESLSQAYNNTIFIEEGEIYAGQPQAGHALFAHDNEETIIIGVLIRKKAFFRFFLPLLATSSELFNFFLNPHTKTFSDEYIHFKPNDNSEIKQLLEMMVIEYASQNSDTQAVLRPLTISYLAYLSREYTEVKQKVSDRISDRVLEYLNMHFKHANLLNTAEHFGYHPNYLSALIRKETGKTFSELLLQIKMERAAAMLENTNLTVNDISIFLGYSSTSNFYKAYRSYYHTRPRD